MSVVNDTGEHESPAWLPVFNLAVSGRWTRLEIRVDGLSHDLLGAFATPTADG